MSYDFLLEVFIKYVYWFNPLFIFNGNRIKKYPDNLIEKKHKLLIINKV